MRKHTRPCTDNVRAKLMKPFPTRRYLDPSDFYKVGILASVVTAAVIITLGYVIMRAIGL